MRTQGFTFIELLFSVSLSVILLGVIFVYASSVMQQVDALIQRIQYQQQVIAAIKLLEHDVSQAGSFGSTRAAVKESGLHGIHGDAEHLSLMYRGKPVMQIKSGRDDVINVETGYTFSKNQWVVIANPEKVMVNRVIRVSPRHDDCQLVLSTPFKTIAQASVAAYRQHDYFYDPQKQAVMERIEQSPPQILLDHVTRMKIVYDIKTKAGVFHKNNILSQEVVEVVGIHIELDAYHHKWLVYSPVWMNV